MHNFSDDHFLASILHALTWVCFHRHVNEGLGVVEEHCGLHSMEQRTSAVDLTETQIQTHSVSKVTMPVQTDLS